MQTFKYIFIFLPSLCSAWTEPLILSQSYSGSPYINANSKQQALVAWTTSNYDDISIQSSFFDGSSWGSQEIIKANGFNTNPKICLDDSANSFIIWEKLDKEERYLFASKKGNSSVWEEPEMLALIGSSSTPNISINRNGQCAVILSTTEGFVEIHRTTSLSGWEEAQVIGNEEGIIRELKVKVTSSGDIVAAWYDASQTSIYYTHTQNGFDSDWTAPVAIYRTPEIVNFNMNVIDLNNCVLSWNDIDSQYVAITKCTDGKWQNPPDILSISTYWLRTAPDGLMTYLSWLDFETGLIKALKFDGNTISPETQISNSTSSLPPFICGINNETAIVGWTDDNSGQITTSEYLSDGSVTEPKTISTGDYNVSPKFIQSGGLTIAVWENFTGTDQTIQVSVDAK